MFANGNSYYKIVFHSKFLFYLENINGTLIMTSPQKYPPFHFQQATSIRYISEGFELLIKYFQWLCPCI